MKVKAILLSILLLFACRYAHSENHRIDSLKKAIQNSPNDTNKVIQYIQLASWYQSLNLDSFFSVSKKAISLAEQLNHPWGLARGKYNVGVYYAQADSLDNAFNFFKESLTIAQSQNDIKYVARLHTALGNAHFYKGETKLAEDQFWKAIYYQIQVSDSFGLFISYSQLGNVYGLQSNINKAFGSYLKALDIAEKIGNRSKIAVAYKYIADLLIDKNDADLAIDYLNKALSIFKQLNDQGNIANGYEVMARAYDLKKDYQEAKKYYLEALSIYEAMHFDFRVMICLSSLADIYIKLGEYDNALANEQKSLQLNEQTKNTLHQGLSYQNLGTIYLRKNDFLSSIMMLSKSIELFSELNNLTDLSISYSLLAEAYSKKNDYKNAFETQLVFDSIQSVMNEEKQEKSFAEMRGKFESDRKDKEIEIRDLKLNDKNAKIEKQRLLIYSSLSVVGLLAIITFLIVMVNNRTKNKLLIEEEKKKIAFQNKLMELEQKALRAQMNPHFIFNALSSIQSFIANNNSDQATKLLAKFSKLMRFILNNSREKTISLESEIKLLEYYLELQQLSYNNKFNFKIEIGSDIDVENIGIPPMLIQPFVENAIVHGIAGKTERGNITLRIKLVGEYVQIEIEDDGIGREKALIQKQQMESLHKSVGLLITKERIDIFNAEHQQHIKVDVLDLKDNNGNAVGTKGILQFPLTQLYN